MDHVQQPYGSNLCGQACIAMLSGSSLNDAVRLVGKSGLTRTRDLVAAIRTGRGFLMGVRCPDSLIRLRENSLPRNCIVKASSPDRKRSHWMLIWKYVLHDPSVTFLSPDVCRWDITSYLPLIGGICGRDS
jgi:hypothetical protein